MHISNAVCVLIVDVVFVHMFNDVFIHYSIMFFAHVLWAHLYMLYVQFLRMSRGVLFALCAGFSMCYVWVLVCIMCRFWFVFCAGAGRSSVQCADTNLAALLRAYLAGKGWPPAQGKGTTRAQGKAHCNRLCHMGAGDAGGIPDPS